MSTLFRDSSNEMSFEFHASDFKVPPTERSLYFRNCCTIGVGEPNISIVTGLRGATAG